MRGTVILATRNRPAQARGAVASVLESLPPGWHAVVVDQSDGDTTARSLAELSHDDRLTVIRSARRGLSAARNDGVVAARGEILLFTDDDCIVDRRWATAWQEAFESHASMGIGFGRVSAPAFDPALGFTPAFDPGAATHTHDRSVFREGIAAVGMGANMAMPRGVLEAAGGFDEHLGAGRRFAGAEETDMAFRVARLGLRIGHVATSQVVHHGFRPTSDASALAYAYALGSGAMYAKHVRLRDMYAAESALREVSRLGAKVVQGLATGRRPLGVRALAGLLRGMTSSLRLSVDRSHRMYAPGGSPDDGA